MSCIFCKIVKKEAKSNIVYENEDFIIINDIKPDAKIHMLSIPKKHVKNLFFSGPEDIDVIHKMIKHISKYAVEYGLKDGYRLIINNGQNGSQTVDHLHMQILGGQQLRHPVSHWDLAK